MKKLFILIGIITAFNAGAQTEAVLNTTIKKGYGNFEINTKKFPLNSVIVNVDVNDTALVQLVLVNHCAQFPNDAISKPKKRVKYINGTTGVAFTSMTELKNYCDSFLYSH